MMFTPDHAFSAVMYSVSISLLLFVVFGGIHGMVMNHREQNARNIQREINAELDELKYTQEAYWAGKFKEYKTYGCTYLY